MDHSNDKVFCITTWPFQWMLLTANKNENHIQFALSFINIVPCVFVWWNFLPQGYCNDLTSLYLFWNSFEVHHLLWRTLSTFFSSGRGKHYSQATRDPPIKLCLTKLIADLKIRGGDWMVFVRWWPSCNFGMHEIGKVSLVANTRTTILMPYLWIESLELIWRSGTCRLPCL